MRLAGSTLQTASAITWGLVAIVGPLLHRVPADGLWGTLLWWTLGILAGVSTLALVVLTTFKLVGDALFPDWIDRWWDRPPDP